MRQSSTSPRHSPRKTSPRSPLFEEHPFSAPASPEIDDSRAKEGLWKALVERYDKNAESIERVADWNYEYLAKQDSARLRQAMHSFKETENAVSKAILALGNVQPATEGAAFAFHSVAALNISRHGNDKKILVVMMQMQRMMCALFPLRHVRAPDQLNDSGDPFEASLRPLLTTIAQEIKQCGSDLTYYSKKSAVRKILNARIYEHRFASHIIAFTRRCCELRSLLSCPSASSQPVGVEEHALDGCGNPDTTAHHIIRQLFRNLDSPQETVATTFIENNGGIDECMEDDTLLRKLLMISGQPVSMDLLYGDIAPASPTFQFAGAMKGTKTEEGSSCEEAHKPDNDLFVPHVNTAEQLRVARVNIKKELALDLSAAFEDHAARFEAMLKLQNSNMELPELQGQQDVLESAVVHSRVHLKHPILQAIWGRMGRKAAVQMEHFLRGLLDELRDAESASMARVHRTTPIKAVSTNMRLSPTKRNTVKPRTPVPPFSPETQEPYVDHSESWVSHYLDDAHTQPILEAMNEGRSRLISVRDVSIFDSARPADCSLPCWFAYWAAGWHLALTTYRSKIHRLLQQIHNKCAPPSSTKWNGNHDLNFFANRKLVDEYRASAHIDRLDMLLRSTRPSARDTCHDNRLLALACEITKAKEARIKANLEDLGYVIRSPQDARLVIGLDRVETSIYPLLYLLLLRHVEVLGLASHYILGEDEFLTHARSVLHVFTLFDERMENLEATFASKGLDVGHQFRTFAYGMFYASFKEKDRWPPINIDKMTILEFDDFDEPLGFYADSIRVTSTAPDRLPKGGRQPDVSILTTAPVSRPDISEVDQSLFKDAVSARFLGLDGVGDVMKGSTPSETVLGTTAEDVLAFITHSLCGYWTVAVTRTTPDSDPESPYQLWHCVLTAGRRPGTVFGKGESVYGPVEVKGRIFEHQETSDSTTASMGEDTKSPQLLQYAVHLVASVEKALYPSVRFRGVYDARRDQIRGTFSYIESNDEDVRSQCNTTARELGVQESNVVKGGGVEAYSSAIVDKCEEDPLGNGLPLDVAGFATPTNANASDPTPIVKLSPESFDETTANEDELVVFTRVPVELYRFRRHIDGYSPELTASPSSKDSRPRSLWSFACQAVRYHVQKKLGSKSFTHARLTERRLWIKISMDLKYDRSLGQMGRAQLTPSAWRQLSTLQATVPPFNSRLYDLTADFFVQRGVRFIGRYYCDVCHAIISIGNRHHCISCVAEGQSNQVDLCWRCLDKAWLSTDAAYTNHLPTHSLIRSRRMVVNFEKKALHDRAKEKETSFRVRFARLLASKGVLSEAARKANRGRVVSPLVCGCCGDLLALPCWVCLECDGDVFQCAQCDTDHVSLQSGSRPGEVRHPSYEFHTARHHMLLLRSC